MATLVGRWHDVAPAGSFKDGVPQRHIVADQMVMVLRQGGAWYGANALCPHKYGALSDGKVGDGCITCPIHDATFDLETGEPGEGEDWAGRLAVFPVQVHNGMIQVCMD